MTWKLAETNFKERDRERERELQKQLAPRPNWEILGGKMMISSSRGRRVWRIRAINKLWMHAIHAPRIRVSSHHLSLKNSTPTKYQTLEQEYKTLSLSLSWNIYEASNRFFLSYKAHHHFPIFPCLSTKTSSWFGAFFSYQNYAFFLMEEVEERKLMSLSTHK